MKITKLIDRTTLKFLLVGVINTIVGTSVMFFSYNVVHLNYWISSAANYVVGSVVSYILNKYFTFQNSERSVKQLIYFIVNISVCYLIAYGAAKPLVYRILDSASTAIRDNCAMVAGMCLFVVLNYLGQRFVVFKKKA